MRRWTSEQVAELDDRDAYYSPGLIRVETPEYLLFLVPGTLSPNCVRRFQTDAGSAERVMEEVLQRVRRAGGTGMRWVVNSRSTPADLAGRLLRHGFELSAPAEILYRDLGTEAGPDLPPARAAREISVREACNDHEVDVFMTLGERIFLEPPAPREFMEQLRSHTRKSVEATGHSQLFLAFDGGVPVGRAGLTVTGSVGRLWTAGVLADHRRKGVYQLLTRERCRAALEQGARLAITHAVIATSGAILRRRGFQSAGPYDYYRVRWDRGGPHRPVKRQNHLGTRAKPYERAHGATPARTSEPGKGLTVRRRTSAGSSSTVLRSGASPPS
ncbi:MAG: GNAT family N-acetyltransferase [Thermoplasmata archaeon]